MNIVGLDLGQVSDPSALSVFTRRDFPKTPLSVLPAKPEKFGPPKPAPSRDWELPDLNPQAAAEKRFREMSPFVTGERAFDAEVVADAPRVETERYYLCRALRKWQLGTSFVRVVQDVRALCGQHRLQVDTDGAIRPPTLVVDATGLGAPVIDMLIAAKVPAILIAITITGGNTIREDEKRKNHFFVPKFVLVNTLQVLLQSGRVDFTPKLRDPVTGEDMETALKKELQDFRVHTTKAAKGGESFEAEEGSKDDLLLSACYACWWGQRGGKTPKVW